MFLHDIPCVYNCVTAIGFWPACLRVSMLQEHSPWWWCITLFSFLPTHLNLSWLSPIIETLLVDSSLATKIAVSKEVEIIAWKKEKKKKKEASKNRKWVVYNWVLYFLLVVWVVFSCVDWLLASVCGFLVVFLLRSRRFLCNAGVSCTQWAADLMVGRLILHSEAND